MRRKMLSIALFAILALGCSAQASAKNIKIDQKAFPDKVIRRELGYWDANDDGSLSPKEAKKITEMILYPNVNYKKKTIDFSGIQKLKWLKKLSISQGYRVKNLKSKFIKEMYVDQYALSGLNLKNVPNLQKFYVEPEDESDDDAESVSYNPVKKPLRDFSCLPKLRVLHYDYDESKRVVLNVSKNRKLTELVVGAHIRELNFNKLPNLKTLRLSNMEGDCLDVSMLNKLTSLTYETPKNQLILPVQSVLNSLRVSSVQGVDVSGQSELSVLQMEGGTLKSNLAQNQKLEMLFLENVKVEKELDLSNKTLLKEVKLSWISNQTIALQQSGELQELSIDHAVGLTLQMPQSETFKKLWLEETNISEIDLTGCPNVEEIVLEVRGVEDVMPKILTKTLTGLKKVTLQGNSSNASSAAYVLDSFNIAGADQLESLYIVDMPNYIVNLNWFPNLRYTNL